MLSSTGGMEPTADIPRSLRWRCRRGMRELDALLGGWLETRWPSAAPDMQQAFAALLEQEDDQLWDWLLGRSTPPDRALEQIVADVRQHAGSE